LTPTYVKDFERFELLCESIDRMVSGWDRHYVLVNPDEDVERFQKFASDRRIILPSSKFLPRWLLSAPAWFSKNGRRVWLSPFSMPVHGWHVQQLLKIAGVLAAEEERVCIIDSDNLFFRPFNVAAYAGRDRSPLYVDRGHIAADMPHHADWTRNAARLLNQPEPSWPADDYIGQAIVWDRATVKAMTERIEDTAGLSWPLALCRVRQFSEYLLYGNFVSNTPEFAAQHEIVEGSLAQSHWEEHELDEQWIATMMAEAGPEQVAICIQSYSGTAVPAIRSAVNKTLAA
jgi:Family of unknown function (DUF6492)